MTDPSPAILGFIFEGEDSGTASSTGGRVFDMVVCKNKASFLEGPVGESTEGQATKVSFVCDAG